MRTRQYLFAGFAALVSYLVSGCESTGSKKEYSILQEIESARRGMRLDPQVEIIESKDYWCAGFLSIDKKEKVWVLLNAKYSPFYKQVDGKAAYWISEIDFQALKSKNVCSATVLSVFQSRVGP